MGTPRLLGLLAVLLLGATLAVSAGSPLRYAGATTLQRYFMPEAARLFNEETGVLFTIEGGNTNPGIGALLKDEVDLAGAGRHLTEAETKLGLVEHMIGWDVLAIVVHQGNPVEDLSTQQLQAIFSGEVTNWLQVGGPDKPMIVVTCPKGSGMRSAVQQLILKDKDYLRQEITTAIVAEADQQVSLFPSAITALSLSMVDNPQIKMIKVDGVEPTPENLANGKYPLSKVLALVTKGQPQGDLARFIELATGPRGQAIMKRNFVPRVP